LGRWPLGTVLHSSNEPGELSQWLCHDDNTINIVLNIIIIINTAAARSTATICEEAMFTMLDGAVNSQRDVINMSDGHRNVVIE